MNNLSTLFILGDSWIMLSLTEAVSVGIEEADRFFTGRGAKVRRIGGLLGSIHKIFSIMWKWENTKMRIVSQQTFLKKTHREVKSPHGFQSPSQQKQKNQSLRKLAWGEVRRRADFYELWRTFFFTKWQWQITSEADIITEIWVIGCPSSLNIIEKASIK